MSATGKFIDSERALRFGLVNEVVPHEQLLDHAMRVAHDIVTNDEAAVRALFDGYLESVNEPPERALKAEHLRAMRWQGSGFDPGRIAARRTGVTDRGRSQGAIPAAVFWNQRPRFAGGGRRPTNLATDPAYRGAPVRCRSGIPPRSGRSFPCRSTEGCRRNGTSLVIATSLITGWDGA